MNRRNLLTMVLLFIGTTVLAQSFAPAFNGFSRKKPTYITMKDGSEKTVYIKSLKFKKGLIDELKVTDSVTDKKVKIKPDNIDFMYVPPSGLAKIAQKMEAMSDLTKMQDGELSSKHLNDGYLFMESSKVQVKKNKVQYCMVQLMNPTFSGKIKVYNDPFAKESASLSVGGMKVAGGLDKSYYIKKEGEEIARRIKKKDYKRDMEELFSECPVVVEKYGDSPQWSDFEEFIFDYSAMCD